jgi:hypothetical protein
MYTHAWHEHPCMICMYVYGANMHAMSATALVGVSHAWHEHPCIICACTCMAQTCTPCRLHQACQRHLWHAVTGSARCIAVFLPLRGGYCGSPSGPYAALTS